MSAKSFTDRSGVFFPNSDESYLIIKNLKPEVGTGFCNKLEARGQSRIKFSDLPEYAWDNAFRMADEDIVYREGETIIDSQISDRKLLDGEVIAKKGEMTRWVVKQNRDGKHHISEGAEGLELTAFISFLTGAIMKLQEKVETLESKVGM
jgi:hypothetical protein